VFAVAAFWFALVVFVGIKGRGALAINMDTAARAQ